MAVKLSSLARAGWQFFDNLGTPLAGGLLYTFLQIAIQTGRQLGQENQQ